ncbi:hypothetical protein NZ708_08015 [Pseudomonas syringae pv. actinidiae ICMP 18708]|nr:hypothetical protein IYO_008025 [Pseudomonas syringae pv. actinidiae ICMP 18884]AOE55947.1 hypothetical protein NZ708_08015 [Pseudomonas syringae pv. actinidiae ICMP 18708]APP96914.1 hypothetical protein PsaNZ45_08570 [Pseudomonas syringae pv. actinidiae]AYL80126.1 hypothetical protein CN228_09245 [Pseudomonas syringae pv. actinidiae str. Shaanxi_M228]EPN60046.1 hypothetical protein A235_25386 [Pseudomonas syringae pv. actinidiae ICMP 19079]
MADKPWALSRTRTKKRPVPKLSFGTGRCNLTSPRASVMFRDRRLLAWINRFTCNARLKKQTTRRN